MKNHTGKNTKALKTATRLVTTGRSPKEQDGFVNPPVIHASTVVFDSTEQLYSGKSKFAYGRRGTPTTNALTDALTDLEGAHGSVLAPSGLAACSLALLSACKAGDHVLITDSVYEPTRNFAKTVLEPMGVEVQYYDPLIGGEIATLFKDNTSAVFTEAPGSQTFEMQDIPAIVAACKDRDILVLLDNTWGTPLYFDSMGHGVDITIQAGTKYIVGHSDVMLGTISANERAWGRLYDVHGAMGYHVGPDDVYLALRGLRTMGIRLRQHQESAFEMAQWLEARPEVDRVLYPPLPSDPGHAIWKRDFTGACGLMGVVLKDVSKKQACAFIDALDLFGLGYSWGGFESLVIHADPRNYRTATTWNEPGQLIRLHIGLEDVSDLKEDLEGGFAALSSAK
ncbi:cystathionine beta-lyase [Cohaesibacter sp. CAU 1516]|uniref:cystathionine beta-lyase n=1 Tax=Cohaesibacter sp. CAU 1516 TaxID=2576038 RepID=UPI0010FF440E|nr:cystathionine beta-lyase [Cohaesibacter sp. CAU 1516]TLP49231.1 cystathionine beta-lyase [Cohaesibacter sp. CAU 1516]